MFSEQSSWTAGASRRSCAHLRRKRDGSAEDTLRERWCREEGTTLSSPLSVRPLAGQLSPTMQSPYEASMSFRTESTQNYYDAIF